MTLTAQGLTIKFHASLRAVREILWRRGRRPSASDERNALRKPGFRRASFVVLAAALVGAAPALGEPKAFSPSFWDPHARPAKPDLADLRALRFLTDDDYPPFHFALPDGSLAG